MKQDELQRKTTAALQALQDIADKLRETAKELRTGMSPHHAANRLDKIADLISKEEA